MFIVLFRAIGVVFMLIILCCVGDIVQLRLKKRSFDEKRRDALNKILDIKGNELLVNLALECVYLLLLLMY